jgi:trk system potassium uptake protein
LLQISKFTLTLLKFFNEFFGINQTKKIANQIIPQHLHPSHILVLSFVAVIFLGAGLLCLPYSTTVGRAPFIDALFTATSATCVTGLAINDVGHYWSFFGQLVILFLIQIGGLGTMTLSTLFAYVVARKISFLNRELIDQSIGGAHFPKLGRLILIIVGLTLLIETVGGAILTVRFMSEYQLRDAIFLGFFHSVSAFCNAGFSLFTDNLMNYRTDIVINLTIMSLIVCGGLGFWVLIDLKNLFKRMSKHRGLSQHSKIVLTTTASLIVFSTILLLLFEWNNTIKDLSIGNKIQSAAFQAITPRTAGFNTLDIKSMTNSSLLFIIILMFIGASPGSTGGGIKTTTFAVAIAIALSRLKDRRQVVIFNKGVPESTISKSIAITFCALFFITVITLILMMTEHPANVQSNSGFLFIEVIFEAFSAIGTVGLSMGLTPFLSVIGKLLISFLMFIGRVGPLTLALIFTGASSRILRVQYAEENFWVG